MIPTLEGEGTWISGCPAATAKSIARQHRSGLTLKIIHGSMILADERPSSAQSQTEDEVERDDDDEITAVPLPPSSRESESLRDGDHHHPGLGRKQKIPANSTNKSTVNKRRRTATTGVHNKLLPSLDHLPQNPSYHRSYMHRSIITDVAITETTVIVGSDDGRLTFWHRENNAENSLTFIKSFQAHRGEFNAIHLTNRQDMVVTTSSHDKTVKVFTISNVDLAQFTSLSTPDNPSKSICSVLSPDRILIPLENRPAILVFVLHDISQKPTEIDVTNQQGPLSHLVANHRFNALILCSLSSSALDYVSIPTHKPFIQSDFDGTTDERDHSRSKIELSHDISGLKFQSRLRTDLFKLARDKVEVTCINVSPTGMDFVVAGIDSQIRIFDFLSGRIRRIYNESRTYSGLGINLPPEEIARRQARNDQYYANFESVRNANVVWDESGSLIIYASMLGVKIVDVSSNRVVRTLGLREAAVRFVCVALAHGNLRNIDESSKSNNVLLTASAFDSERIFLFGTGGPSINESSRDVHNERPMIRKRHHMSNANDKSTAGKNLNVSSNRVTLHTSMGDIAISLLPNHAPKAVRNFVTHSKNSYFNGVTFHRVIPNFMIQTGDPDGDGTGGESIWGASFEDEIVDDLNHEIGTVSMANAGPNTNGSVSFFFRTACWSIS